MLYPQVHVGKNDRVKETFNGTEMGHETFKTSLWEIIGHTCSCFELREWPSSCLGHLSTFACIFLFGTHTTYFLKVFISVLGCVSLARLIAATSCFDVSNVMAFLLNLCHWNGCECCKWQCRGHYSYHHSGLLLQLLLHSIQDSYMSLFINCKTTY